MTNMTIIKLNGLEQLPSDQYPEEEDSQCLIGYIISIELTVYVEYFEISGSYEITLISHTTQKPIVRVAFPKSHEGCSIIKKYSKSRMNPRKVALKITELVLGLLNPEELSKVIREVYKQGFERGVMRNLEDTKKELDGKIRRMYNHRYNNV